MNEKMEISGSKLSLQGIASLRFYITRELDYFFHTVGIICFVGIVYKTNDSPFLIKSFYKH